MTSKHPTAEWECRKLQEFKEFLRSLSADSAVVNSGGVEMRAVTRSSNETYPVTTEELRPEVVMSIWNHLTTKRCPRDFQLSLLRAAVDEVELERTNMQKCDFASVGGTGGCSDADEGTGDQKTLYDLIKLQKFALNNLEKLLTRLTDNAEANNLQNYATEGSLCTTKCLCENPMQSSSITSYLAAGVKNKPRKMEDRHCCWDHFGDVFQIKSSSFQYSFYGVFDGHSGPLAAIFAASQLPYLCAERLKQSDSGPVERMEALKSAFLDVDKMFTNKHITSGTTAVCALYCRGTNSAAAQLHVAWVGDSKAMLVSKTSRKQLVKPHVPDCPDERKRIESNGLGTVMHIQGQWRVNGILNVSRSIGDYSVSSVIADPDVVSVDLQDEDFLVLGTDGLWDHASEKDIARTVYEGLSTKNTNLDEVPKMLIDLAKRGDSQDNITVVIVLLREAAKIAEEHMSEKPLEVT